MPSFKMVAWIAGISLLVVMGYQHYGEKKG